jgi:ABC-type branched-subunit amino acid transport system ATPase component/ABC-type branched-subunit amino acid transport system permease subunit
MTTFISLLITGGVTGGIYAILASGLVITYLTSGIFNFSYGAVAFSVAYFYYQLQAGLDVPRPLAAVLAILVFGPLLGLVLDILIYRHLVKAPLMARIVAPVGVLVALPNLILLISDKLVDAGVGLADRNFIFAPAGLGPYPAKIFSFWHGAPITSDQLVVFGAALLVSVALWVVIKRLPLGLRMRAVVDRRELASLRGVDPARVSTQAVVLSSLLAGLSGVVLAPSFNLAPDKYTYLMFVAAAAAALGAFKSIPLAMIGGVFLGISQSLLAGYVTISSGLVPGLQSAIPFIILFGVLFFLGRQRARVAGVVADDPPAAEYLSDLPAWRRALPWVVVTGFLIVFIHESSGYHASLTALGLALAIVFLSFVVVTGIGGLVSLAQAAFVSVGAIVAALAISHGVPFAVAVLIGAAAACVLGLVVAIPSLRLGGLSLALSTLAAGYLCDQLLFNVESLTGGSAGRPLVVPKMAGIDFGDSRNYAYLLLVVFGIVALGVRNLMRSKTGRVMVALRSSEAAAVTAGASRSIPRLALFGVSAAIAGFGGALLEANNQRITATDFPTQLGLFWVATMVVFGVRRPGGALVAGVMTYLFPEILATFTDTTLLPPILFGMGAMTLAQQPDGFMAVMGINGMARRKRRADQRRRRAEAQVASAAGILSAQHEAAAPIASAPGRSAPAHELAGQALTLDGVSAGYDGVMALHDIHLSVPEGSFFGVIGPNGAGKSTLCSVIAGLVPASTGSVVTSGRNITDMPPHQRARTELFLAPEYRGVFPGLSVEENLEVWLRAPAARRSAMQRFPVLAERRKVPAGSLSGGEQQLLTLVAALERPPKLLVLDEPTLGLSPIAINQVFAMLSELHRLGTTVVVVEEQAPRAAQHADTLVLLDRGRVKWQGPSAEFSSGFAHELYLGATGRS